MTSTPFPGRTAYFLAQPRNQYGRLRIVPGPSRDHNGAFSGLVDERLPRFFDMRGRGRTPVPNEIAVFGAHGSPTGFTAFRTKQAARAMADAIVRANRVPGAKQIKATVLSSCGQGTRRFLMVGKTNAEAFQEHINMRLRELGIDPAGPKGITVLAADRPGPLWGADETKILGQYKPTTFVPAGTQRPLKYPYSAMKAQAMEGLVLAEILVLAGGAIVAVRVAEQRDPGVVMRVVSEHPDKILGYVFESVAPRGRTLQLPLGRRPELTSYASHQVMALRAAEGGPADAVAAAHDVGAVGFVIEAEGVAELVGQRGGRRIGPHQDHAVAGEPLTAGTQAGAVHEHDGNRSRRGAPCERGTTPPRPRVRLVDPHVLDRADRELHSRGPELGRRPPHELPDRLRTRRRRVLRRRDHDRQPHLSRRGVRHRRTPHHQQRKSKCPFHAVSTRRHGPRPRRHINPGRRGRRTGARFRPC